MTPCATPSDTWPRRANGYSRALFALFLAFMALPYFIACGDASDEDSPATQSATPPPTLPTSDIIVRSEDGAVTEELTVELATTAPERQQGLMHREEMDEERGMLFLFPEVQGEGRGFWMRNTLIPLTIAYLDADGTVLKLMDGTPLDETILRPELPYYAVLEVNQGWFERHDLGVGSVVEIPDDAPEPQ